MPETESMFPAELRPATGAAPWLSEAEINELCRPKRRADAQVRYLQSMGLVVKRKANGKPLVIRSHFDAVMSGAKSTAADQAQPTQPRGPNVSGLLLHFGRKAAA